jgi:hypothetical protein
VTRIVCDDEAVHDSRQEHCAELTRAVAGVRIADVGQLSRPTNAHTSAGPG